MTLIRMLVGGVLVGLLATAFTVNLRGLQEYHSGMEICAEINWQSPTCERIKKERLTP